MRGEHHRLVRLPRVNHSCGDVRRDPPRLVVREQLGRRAPPISIGLGRTSGAAAGYP
jgi:hypothetical protein